MGFQDAVRTCLTRKYATFSGRAPRSEYWWFILFTIAGGIVFNIADQGLFAPIGGGQEVGLLAPIFSLAVLLPTIAVGVRRLHDLGRTGWWYLLILIPVLGTLVLIFFFIQKGTDGPNEYGPDPLGS